jgi:hypothetical protein
MGGKVVPAKFRRRKPPVIIRLSLESFDLQSIQLLGSHIEKVEQFFYIDNA